MSQVFVVACATTNTEEHLDPSRLVFVIRLLLLALLLVFRLVLLLVLQKTALLLRVCVAASTGSGYTLEDHGVDTQYTTGKLCYISRTVATLY